MHQNVRLLRIIIIDYAPLIELLIKNGQESNFWESLLVSKVMKL
jgi:hypothetical protein